MGRLVSLALTCAADRPHLVGGLFAEKRAVTIPLHPLSFLIQWSEQTVGGRVTGRRAGAVAVSQG